MEDWRAQRALSAMQRWAEGVRGRVCSPMTMPAWWLMQAQIKGSLLRDDDRWVEALNPAMAGQGLMFARGGTRSVEKSCGATDRWTDQERLDVGLGRTHTPPCAPGSALQKSTGRFVTCAEKIRDV